MRQAIAAAMSRSKREIPHYYLSHSIDLTAATNWLGEHNSELPPDRRILMAALFIKAVALTLRKFPELNGFDRGGRFEPSAAIHVGSATAIRGGGLVAPAIHHADQLALEPSSRRPSPPTTDTATATAAVSSSPSWPTAEDGGFWAEVRGLPGCISEGDDFDETLLNIREAAEGWIAVATEKALED